MQQDRSSQLHPRILCVVSQSPSTVTDETENCQQNHLYVGYKTHLSEYCGTLWVKYQCKLMVCEVHTFSMWVLVKGIFV